MPEHQPLGETEEDWQQTNCYATALRRADRALSRIYDSALKPAHLNTTQYSLLSLISRAPNEITLTDLADAQVIDRTTLSRNLNHLVRNGYVTITRGTDRRKRIISLTPQGIEAIQRARPLWKQAQDQIESERGLSRMNELVNELDALASSASNHIDSDEDATRT